MRSPDDTAWGLVIVICVAMICLTVLMLAGILKV